MDLVSDMLVRIKNGYTSKKQVTFIKYSKLCVNILNILYKEGYINGYSFTNKGFIIVRLRYYRNDYIFKSYFRISKPGRRVYLSSKELKSFYSKTPLVVLSTSAGIITQKQAILFNIGGEVLFELAYS